MGGEAYRARSLSSPRLKAGGSTVSVKVWLVRILELVVAALSVPIALLGPAVKAAACPSAQVICLHARLRVQAREEDFREGS